MRKLELRHNNAYDTVLLLDDLNIIGAWTVTPEVKSNWENPGDLNDWESTNVLEPDPEDYGELVDTQGNVADMITMIDCTDCRSLIGGDSEIESNAREWVGYGFFADAEKWWDAGCFDASCAAELRDAGIDADQVSGDCDLLDGFSWGYAHSNGDVSTEQVIASVKNN